MSNQKRIYQLKARAQQQRETRERIVAATEMLHREVGPARTTITDIARRADVQRLTVYNHFPHLRDLLAACQGHFLAQHPQPDLTPGVPGARALDRLEAALTDLYSWYRANEQMVRNVRRDRYQLPELDELLRANADPGLDAAAIAYANLIAKESLARGRVRSLVRLGLEFGSWEVLAAQGLSDRDMAGLVRSAVQSGQVAR